MPLTVALHCSMVKKPQFVPPPAEPEYCAHHRVLSQGRAAAGVCVSKTGIVARATTVALALKRIASLLISIANNLISTRPRGIAPRSNFKQSAQWTNDVELSTSLSWPVTGVTVAGFLFRAVRTTII
jgi:hypothetical protein